MELIDVLKINGIKFIDSNILHPGNNLIQMIYDCQNSEQIPLNLIISEINHSRNCNYYLSLDDVFSIEEVAKEEEYFLEAVNKSLSYYSSNRIFRFIKVEKNRVKSDY